MTHCTADVPQLTQNEFHLQAASFGGVGEAFASSVHPAAAMPLCFSWPLAHSALSLCFCLYLQTLIKIITGEHKSSSGTVWRHPNLRMAYVAQHAFHHLEEHLDTTPLKYMFKRFGLGQDQVRDCGCGRILVRLPACLQEGDCCALWDSCSCSIATCSPFAAA
jgi:hypothetical protein